MSLVSCVQLAEGWFRKEREQPKELDYLPCSICGNPVRLETSNTDELGKAVHEKCYVLTVAQRTEQVSTHTLCPASVAEKMLDYSPHRGIHYETSRQIGTAALRAENSTCSLGT
jgi:hypothetical protein